MISGFSWFLQIRCETISFGMGDSCDWCGGAISGQTSKCSGCTALVRPFTGLLQSQLPTAAGRARMNSILAPHRGLSPEQRIAGLMENAGPETELPRPFRTRRGPAVRWSEESCELWAEVSRAIRVYGRPIPHMPMPLPGGSLLMIDEDGRQNIDGTKLDRPLPLYDIAIWLSNPDRAGAVADWRLFLLAMSCVVRRLRPLQEEEWAGWMDNEGWPGIDSPSVQIAEPIMGRLTHPFFKFIGKQCEQEADEHTSIGYIARDNPRLMEAIGGAPSEAWLEILEHADDEFGRLFRHMVAPRLVVLDHRLHLLVLRDGKPHPIPVTVDPKVWRVLVAWSLEPPGHLGADTMQHLFWCWSGERESWMPSVRQIRSARMLRKAIDGLGENSSAEPVLYSENTSAISVRGKSGLFYLIFPSSEQRKFVVEAVPNEEYLSKARTGGIQICIDVKSDRDVPAGDIAVSYLLALRDDVSSRMAINTLDALLCVIENSEPGKDELPIAEWWHNITVNHAHFDEGGYDDEYEEEEFDEDIEIEPDPIEQFELPEPGDHQALVEMIERIVSDVQRRQREE